ncbi:hypothetical protein [Salinimicrobium terrae]|uniref:hypothetical protein n=1 Tax=Salinimicrobium terrae TaxID=470866 RepID=UPI0004171E6B|nr:hypothetical protein [Salinimicrobium terrae]
MKKFKISIAWLTVLALTFTSCSKEENDVTGSDTETVQLTFGAMLDAFDNQNKQATQAECRDNAVPAYVMLGISTDEAGTDFIAGGNADNLIEVGLTNNSGSWETTYSDHLELPQDTYYLQHFIVYDASHQVLWVAPREGGAFASEVGDALPQAIELAAGTKPYIAVDVLCFYPREEEAYGYPFFDFDIIEVENSYCIFVNYCYDGTGREYPAHFSVEVWSDTWDGDEVVYSDRMNSISMQGGDPAATVLCLALPDLGDDTYYARVTVRNHDLLPYLSDPDSDYFEFTITQDDIDDQELMVPAYEHVRFNCQPPYGEPTCEPGTVVGDTNGDCIVDCNDTNSCEPGDPCPGIDPALDTNGDCVINCRDTNTCVTNGGCGDTAFMFGDYVLAEHYNGNNWGWGLLIDGVDVDAQFYDEENERWVLPFWAGAGQNDTSKAWRAGDVIIELDDDGEQIHVTIDLYDGVTVGDTHFWFNDDNQWPENRAPGQFDLHKDTDLLSYSFPVDGEDNYTLIVHAGQVCHEDF